MTNLYHQGNRRLQDQFDSRRIADRLETFARAAFTSEDKAFIESMPLLLGDGRCRGAAGLLLQGRHARFRACHGPE